MSRQTLVCRTKTLFWLVGLLFSWIALAESHQAQNPNSTISSITNTVLGTVVDSASGEPVQGVRVTRIEVGGSGRQFETISDERGRFAFASVEAGRWRVVGELSGYESGANDRRRPNGPDRIVDVTPASHPTVVNRLFRSLGTLCGSVVDDENRPAVAITVSAARFFATTADKGVYAMWPGATATDDRGQFCLRLPRDNYVIVVPPTTVTTLRGDQVAQATPTAGLSQQAVQRPSSPFLKIGDFDVFLETRDRIALLPPTTSSARVDWVYDLALNPPQNVAMGHRVVGGQVTSVGQIPLRRVAAHKVSGRVMGPSGPVPDANVRIIPKMFAASTEGVLDIGLARTDRDGAFTMFGIPAGSFVIRATGGPIGTGWAETPLVMADSDASGVLVEIRRGVRASGQVIFAGSAPVTAELRARVSVGLISVDTQILGAPAAKLAVDGTFQTADYQPGRYLLSVTAPAGWVLSSALYERQNVALVPISLTGESSIDVVATLTDRPAILSGHVRTVTGAGDPSATVLLFPVAYHFRLGFGSPGQLFREARVLPDGSFEFPSLAPAEYFVVAVDDAAADGWRASSDVPRFAAGAERIRIQPGDRVIKDLQTQSIRRAP
jgi:hypothetical protein